MEIRGVEEGFKEDRLECRACRPQSRVIDTVSKDVRMFCSCPRLSRSKVNIREMTVDMVFPDPNMDTPDSNGVRLKFLLESLDSTSFSSVC